MGEQLQNGFQLLKFGFCMNVRTNECVDDECVDMWASGGYVFSNIQQLACIYRNYDFFDRKVIIFHWNVALKNHGKCKLIQ